MFFDIFASNVLLNFVETIFLILLNMFKSNELMNILL